MSARSITLLLNKSSSIDSVTKKKLFVLWLIFNGTASDYVIVSKDECHTVHVF